MNDKKNSQKGQKATSHKNVLETLKDVGNSTTKSVKEDLVKGASKDFLRQLLGNYPPRKVSGEVRPGESMEFSDVFSGRHQEELKLKRQISLERKLRQEERVRSEKKANELRLQLEAIMNEVATLVESTQELAQETQIAAMQAPIEPGVYHLIFFEKLLEFIKSFRKKINEANVWLSSTNKRAEKKNYWAKYQKHGSKFLLSGEHYLTRSAG